MEIKEGFTIISVAFGSANGDRYAYSACYTDETKKFAQISIDGFPECILEIPTEESKQALKDALKLGFKRFENSSLLAWAESKRLYQNLLKMSYNK
jgi:hypothetical protein